MLTKIRNFIKKAVKAAISFLKDTAVDVANHTETAISMVVESIGWTVVIGSLPFIIALPMWVEATMVVPVLAVAATFTMASIAIVRQNLGLVIVRS